jgi:hypothetical protein
MLASYSKTPELQLEPAEAKALASALAGVQQHYKIPGLREEHAAIAHLLIVGGTIYGKRLIMIRARQRGVIIRPPAPQNDASQVMQGPDETINAAPWFQAPSGTA